MSYPLGGAWCGFRKKCEKGAEFVKKEKKEAKKSKEIYIKPKNFKKGSGKYENIGHLAGFVQIDEHLNGGRVADAVQYCRYCKSFIYCGICSQAF